MPTEERHQARRSLITEMQAEIHVLSNVHSQLQEVVEDLRQEVEGEKGEEDR